MDSEIQILIAEDNDGDYELLYEQLEERGVPFQLDRVFDGEGVFPFLDNLHKLPDLIMLDINMPVMNGHEVLKLLRDTPKYQAVPKVILTSSSASKDIEMARLEGANGYLLKPAEVSVEDLAVFAQYSKTHPEDFVEITASA